MTSSDKNIEELKSLVVHTLETNGVLGQIRAQLRANVYKAIDSDESLDQREASNASAMKLMKSPLGRLMAEIVAEFFEFYNFKHSLSVFVPEANLGRERRSRAEVAFDAGLARVVSEASILEQLLGLATGSDSAKGGISSASSTTASSPPPTALSQVLTRPSTSDSHFTRSDADSVLADRPAHAQGDRARVTGVPSPAGALSTGLVSSVPAVGRDDRGEPAEESLEAASEVSASSARERRKPLGKLPSLSAAAHAPEVSLADAAAVSMSNDSFEEAREDMLLRQQADQQVARLKGVSAAGGAVSSTAAATAAAQESSRHDVSALSTARSDVSGVSAGSGGSQQIRSPPRSLHSSPAHSPAASSGSAASRSVGPAAASSLPQSESESPLADSKHKAAANARPGLAATFKAEAPASPIGDSREDYSEGSFSMESGGSAASASLDLTGGVGGGAAPTRSIPAGGSTLSRNTTAGRLSTPVADDENSVSLADEVEEEIEDVSEGSIEAYEESEIASADDNF
eukprot:TRINITY_DN9749_c0_g1_i6.p1 TRINITY_DN9749_c0_g1~~TRINITY_DN9749_c0_g1_i6.p1  ORF type:complete len:517 (+),score=105.31 TRINITY_DN9749_c0_g1_i6:57-1607(+)